MLSVSGWYREVAMTTETLCMQLPSTGDTATCTCSQEGIINPKTGKPTGFPFDKDEWSEWIARIN